MSGVEGAREVVDGLQQVVDGLDGIPDALAGVARAAADRRAPTLAQLQPVVNADGAVLNYSGVIAAEPFAEHIASDLDAAAAAAVDDQIDTAIQRAGLA